jgi:hypothetical protein
VTFRDQGVRFLADGTAVDAFTDGELFDWL